MNLLNAYIIDLPLLGKRHSVRVFNVGFAPTRGEALFIGYLVAVNIILSATGYHTVGPGALSPTGTYELASYISNRLGVLSFANLPLIILYSGRNNILSWLTGWPRSTFLMLHRWNALICTLQACLHSTIYLGLSIWEGAHEIKSHLAFWYWGIIAVIAFVLMFPSSMLPMRKLAYEVFLILHITFGVLAIVGLWHHIMYRFGKKRGYETWLYISMAIWGFDRVVRLLNISRFGFKQAFVSKIDDDYFKVDIPNTGNCAAHGYFYFPTLTWRFWESHPFSVTSSNPQISTSLPHNETKGSSCDALPSITIASGTKEEPFTDPSSTSSKASRGGTTLYIRQKAGMTRSLASRSDSIGGVPVLIEPSFEHPLGLAGTSRPNTEYPNTLCIVGGVGITALLPFLCNQSFVRRVNGATTLYWGLRSQALADSIIRDIGAHWDHIQAHVSVGQRFDIKSILSDELGSSRHLGTTVMVCGPPSMSDEVRHEFAALKREGRQVRLVSEQFCW